RRELAPRLQRDAIELARDVERDRGEPALGVAFDPEAVVVSQAGASSRSSRRRIFPEGLFGSDSTKRYSRGRLKRASVSHDRQKASSSSAVSSPSATTTATTR